MLQAALSSGLLLHHHFTLVVKLALIPMGPVIQMRFARGGAYGDSGKLGLVVGPALIPTGAALSAFRMCHDVSMSVFETVFHFSKGVPHGIGLICLVLHFEHL
jgi:hypothetical protein